MHYSFKEKIGQLFFPAAFIHDTEEGIQEIEKLIQEQRIGGLTFFYSRESVETNYDRNKQVTQHRSSLAALKHKIKHYQSLSKTPLLICIDAEWGLGMRMLDFPSFPYPLSLAATQDEALIFEVGKAIGQELASVGVHLNLAPVVDVNLNPNNPVIGYRAFGDNKKQVTRFAKAFYNGMQSEGVLGCLKHFPGHGDTAVDSHLGLPILEKNAVELRDKELFPFKELIKEGVDCVMSGHLAVPAFDSSKLPASLSSEMLMGILRNELGFEGTIISDALNMKSVADRWQTGELEVKALEAGNDILCFSQDTALAIETIAKKVKPNRIEEGFLRVQQLKAKAKLANTGTTQAEKKLGFLDTRLHTALRMATAKQLVTMLKGTNLPTLEEDVLFVSCLKAVHKTPFARLTIPSISVLNDKKVSEVNEHLASAKSVLLALYVPSAKPPNNFGISKDILEFTQTIAHQKPTTLILFGNPYSLSLFALDTFENVVVAYQDLPELEEAVLNFINGELKSRGKLPIQPPKAATHG